ncbi:peptidylprolyl isomerase [Microbacterium halimionae]|uniref:Peptidylprolyl isomerase n=1 Tax=Microbacterium halimionae TaxID=1526413 RepID=A0A7W3PLQ4_9MICO|nr:hypothetical protein [Microbacterium halimionae]MBA8816192.1 peptidylprolyl isomerase [Microbacterium halimionae]NII96394.1 peptidylprolyl isomerase [Microbacterium halimionae]
MRRFPAVVAAVSLFAIALTGCSSAASTNGSASCTREQSSSTAATDLVTVTGEGGSEPNIDVRTPVYTSQTEFVDIARGEEGPTLVSDTQAAILDFVLLDGVTGEVVATTEYASSGNQPAIVSSLYGALPGLEPALECATGGSRVVAVLASDDIAPDSAQSLGLGEDEALVAVVDVQKVYLAKAEGTEQFAEGRGLPTVVRAPNGQPGISFPDHDAAVPDAAVSEVVIRGDGAEVAADDSILVNYTSVDWDTREVQQTSWGAAPQALDMSTVPAEIADALVGQPVGSQVMLVVPSDPASGLEQSLIYIFDILGIDDFNA